MSDFDIEKYKFQGDDYLLCANSYEDGELIALSFDWQADGSVFLNKQDAIALAKHFKITQEDLDDEN